MKTCRFRRVFFFRDTRLFKMIVKLKIKNNGMILSESLGMQQMSHRACRDVVKSLGTVLDRLELTFIEIYPLLTEIQF